MIDRYVGHFINTDTQPFTSARRLNDMAPHRLLYHSAAHTFNGASSTSLGSPLNDHFCCAGGNTQVFGYGVPAKF